MLLPCHLGKRQPSILLPLRTTRPQRPRQHHRPPAHLCSQGSRPRFQQRWCRESRSYSSWKCESFYPTISPSQSALPHCHSIPSRLNRHRRGRCLQSAHGHVRSQRMWQFSPMQAHPELVVSRLAYMRNLVREATRFGGEGWRTYDYVFRSQAATDKSTEWTTTNPSLMLAYMQNGLQPAKPPCPLCHESDHPPSSCALAPLSNTSHHWPARKSSYLGVPTNMPSRLPDGTQLCVSWNQGGCIAIGRCRYRHVCGSCGEGHIARDCAQTPEDSIFKRPPKRPAYARPPAPAPR